MIITIETNKLEDMGLTLNEYLILLTAYYQEHGVMLNYLPNKDMLQSLEEEMYIKITPKGAVLRDKGWKVFEGDLTKFDKFLNLYPRTAPTDRGGTRITSPNAGTTWGNQLRRYWAILTNHNPTLEDEIINKLEYYIKELNRSGNMMYLPKIDNWLEKKTWENITIQTLTNPFEKTI